MALQQTDFAGNNISVLSFGFEKYLELFKTDKEKKDAFINGVIEYNLSSGLGSLKILEKLNERYTPDTYIAKELIPTNHSTIERWIHPPDAKSKAFNVEKCREDNPQLYPYVKMMQNINKCHFPKENISIRFAEHIEKCLYRFNDPLGEKVDLLAQWVVIREYYLRDRVKNKFTADLDAILDCTSWLDVGYDPEQTLYALTVKKDEQNLIPRLTYAMPVGEIINGQFTGNVKDNSYMFNVYAQLRLPYYIVFRDRPRNTILAMPIPNEATRKKLNLKSPEELRQTPLAKSLIASKILKP